MPRPTPTASRDEVEALRRRMAELETESLRWRRLARQSDVETTQAADQHGRGRAAGDAELASTEVLNATLRRANTELEASRAALRGSEARYRIVLDSAIDYAIVTTDLDGRVTAWNAGARNVLGWNEAEMLGRDIRLIFTPEDREAGVPEAEMERARTEGRAADERWHLCRDGPRFWASRLMMPLHEHGATLGYLKVLRDRTAQRAAEEALRAALADKDLLMQEVHHRVKNSLQLVQNLLTLQARSAASPETAAQLQESAGRVNTIAAVHDRLYRGGPGLDVEVEPYLRGLVEDLGAGLASTQEGRVVRLDADPATWPATAVTTLGLVMTELVTNALKYGAGTVSVAFRQPPGSRAMLSVEDEGAGLPEGFDPARGRGLGMRLVTGLLSGPGGGLEVDRGRSATRFVAWFPDQLRAVTSG